MFPTQSIGESDSTYKFRVFTTVTEWVPTVTAEDIPKTGPVRNVWRNMETIRSMTDDELAHDYFETLNNPDLSSASWWGTVVRAWLELLKLERARRYN